MTAYFILIQRGGRQVLRLATLLLLLLLGACTILPASPELQVYLLPAQPAPALSNGQKVDASLRVIQPNTSQFLNSSRIAVQIQGEEIAVYKDSRWSDPAPVLLRNRLIQEFRADGRMQGISSDDDSLQADYELGGDLSAFQGIYRTGDSEVLIRFDAHLVRTADRRIIASRSFEIRQPIRGTPMNDIAQAFGQASDRLASQVLQWTLQQTAG